MDPAILSDFKQPLNEWNQVQMTAFLKKISLSDLVELFNKNRLTGQKFCKIDKNSLLALNISSIKVKKLLNWRQFIQENMDDTNLDPNDIDEQAFQSQEPEIKEFFPESSLRIELISQNEQKLALPQTTDILKTGLEFGRFNNAKLPNIFSINDIQVSEKHCEIQYAGNFFLLSDSGSLNGTFLIIPPEKRLKLEAGMHLEMGNTDFYIKEVTENSLSFDVKTEEKKTPCGYNYGFESMKEVYTIGNDKTQKANTFYIYVKDNYLESVHAKIKYDGEQIYLLTCNNKYGVWLNLKEKDETKKKFAVLQINTIFRISSDFHFKIVEIMQEKKEAIGDCIECEEKKCETVLMPCKHICLCRDCSNKIKKCPMPKCGEKNPKVYRILVYP